MKKLFGPGLSGLGIGSLSYLKTFGQDLQDFQDYFVYLWKAWKNIQSILLILSDFSFFKTESIQLIFSPTSLPPFSSSC